MCTNSHKICQKVDAVCRIGRINYRLGHSTGNKKRNFAIINLLQNSFLLMLRRKANAKHYSKMPSDDLPPDRRGGGVTLKEEG